MGFDRLFWGLSGFVKLLGGQGGYSPVSPWAEGCFLPLRALKGSGRSRRPEADLGFRGVYEVFRLSSGLTVEGAFCGVHDFLHEQ